KAFDTLSFWCFKNERRLVCVCDKGIVKNISCRLDDVNNLVETAAGNLRISSFNRLYLRSPVTKRLQPVTMRTAGTTSPDFGHIKDLIATGPDSYTVSGTYEARAGILQGDTLFCSQVQWGRYDKLKFSNSMNMLCLYRNSRIVIRHGQGKEI